MKVAGLFFSLFIFFAAYAQKGPNVIIICADDLGYGDLGCYGATKLQTPNMDRLAANGIRFTNGHCTSATCTPSRYAMLTGMYPWRKKGTGVLPGDAALIIPTNTGTLPSLFASAGYATGIVGKWHLGLGDSVAKNWNATIQKGPNDIGFGYSFIFPATADRVPTVFLENQQVVASDSSDPIQVSYQHPIGDEPTGRDHPELLKLHASPGQGHDGTIVNGIGRIGYMQGGRLARWTDEEMPLTFLEKAKTFISRHTQQPFFLCYNLTEPHVPRMPSTMFRGKSGLGLRGDTILQLDWSVGEILKELERLHLTQNTLVIFTSDNGPVLDDGYQDGAVTLLQGHKPGGPLRGGKYSLFEAGTRVPFIVSWPAQVKPGTSEALLCQVDWLASFAALLNKTLPAGVGADSQNQLPALLGRSATGRTSLVEHAGALAIISGKWKYIPANNIQPYYKLTDTETGGSTEPQLYDLQQDIGEINNLAKKFPDVCASLQALLDASLRK
ncbi:MAG TPA: arylsulfatase [Flavihumibacter sp.]|nr:arylsulfatase [Flavihumibacter sp.]